MKKFALFAVPLLSAGGAFAAPLTAPTLSDVVNNGNGSTATITNGAAGYLIQPLGIALVEQLVFPDLVIPPSDSDASTAISSVVLTKANAGLSVTYGGHGSPATADASTTSDLINASSNTLSPKLGKITISGHGGKAISVSVSPSATTPTLAADGYAFQIAVIGAEATTTSGGVSSSSFTLGAASDGEESIDIEYGGTFSANKNAISKTSNVYSDLSVVVSYRGEASSGAGSGEI